MVLVEPNGTQKNFFKERKAWAQSNGEFMLIFGGCDDGKVATNELYMITSDHTVNKEDVLDLKGNYQTKYNDILYIKSKKVETQGQKPAPRFGHSVCLFMDNKYMALFGGKNNEVYPQIQSQILNDLHLLDLKLMAWIPIVLYGKIPDCRYLHQMQPGPSDDSLFIWGGIGNQFYMQSTEWQLIDFKEEKLRDYLAEHRQHLKQVAALVKAENRSAPGNYAIDRRSQEKEGLLKLKEATG